MATPSSPCVRAGAGVPARRAACVVRLRTAAPRAAGILESAEIGIMSWERTGLDRLEPAPSGRLAWAEPHIGRMLRVARGILCSDDLAQDAVQETLIRLWRRETSRPEPLARVLGLVRLSSLHILRCQRRRRWHEEDAGIERTEPCCDQDPVQVHASSERAAAIAEAVSGIADLYRKVFELHEFEGAGYAEIAQRLGIPIGTVRSRLSRARAQVRAKVGARSSPRAATQLG